MSKEPDEILMEIEKLRKKLHDLGLIWERAYQKKQENGNYYIVPEPIDSEFEESM